MKNIIIFIGILLFSMSASAQCMIYAEEELAKYGHGTYLIHQELNNNVRDANLLLYKRNIYTLYLMNPSHNKMQYNLTHDFNTQAKYIMVNNNAAGYQKYVINVQADLEHKITLNMEKGIKGCILMAVYLEDSLSEKQAGIYNSFEVFRQNTPDKGYITSFTEEKEVISSGRQVQELYYYSISNEEEKKLYKKIYGFCDGVDIYLNVSSVDRLFGRNNRFVKTEKIGPYYYLKTTRLIMASNVTVPVVVQLLIDNHSGEVTEFTANALKSIISDNQELVKEFQSENHKTDKLRIYLKRYYHDQRI